MTASFTKCPACGAINSRTAAACRCGCPLPSSGAAAHDPAVYRLRAKVSAAEQRVAQAQSALATSPSDSVLTAELLLAQQALNAARADVQAKLSRLRRAPAQSRALDVPGNVSAAARTPPRQPAPSEISEDMSSDAGDDAIPTKVVAHPVADAGRASSVARPGASVAAQVVSAARVPPAEDTSRTSDARPEPATTPSRAPTKSCPVCTADVALDAARCRCGFQFTDGSELPSIDIGPVAKRHAG